LIRLLQGDCRDVLKTLPDESVHCVVTSPPYWGLRDYGVAGQLGLEDTPREYVERMVEVFAHVGRVLRRDGTLWLNLGDSYSAHAGQRKVTDRAGIKQQSNVASVGAPSRCVEELGAKQLVGIPWRVAFALQEAGWWLRSDIIWHKPNQMPESVTDRCTKAHEYIFMLSKKEHYYFDADAIKEPLAAPEKRGRSATVSLRYSQESGRAGDSGLTNKEPLEDRNKRSVWTVPTKAYGEAHFATFPQT
jgi:DNA modification methylase